MIDERQQELAALYALDLLEGNEKSVFEAELKNNRELQKSVHELRESSANLAFSVPQVSPPPELKSRILAQIAAAPAPASRRPNKVFWLRPEVLVPWAIAAGLALGCLWFSQLYLTTRAENAVLQDQRTLAELDLSSSRNQLEAERILANQQVRSATEQLTQLNQQVEQSTSKLAQATGVLGDTFRELDQVKAELAGRQEQLARLNEQIAIDKTQMAELRERLKTEGDLAQFKIATLASMAGNSPQALAVAVWNPKTQQGVLRVEKLPALASDKDYQLWLIDPAYPAPVDGGVFTVDPATGNAQVNFKPSQRVNNATKFAVSLERKGGVPKAEGPILLLGD
jgi:anti-sigma-K factor RskA